MNLETEMKLKADLHNSLGNKGYNCIRLDYAIRIAKEYAEEMCKEKIQALIIWADERYDAEVKNRPDVNIHKRTLHETWMQVITKLATEVK